MFEQAVGLDPNLSEAQALLGDLHRLTALYGLVPAAAGMPRARAAAERALAIDPKQVEALTTLANIETSYHWNSDASHRLSARALAIDPLHVRAMAERAIADAMTVPVISPESRQRIPGDMRRVRERDPFNTWVRSVEAMSWPAWDRCRRPWLAPRGRLASTARISPRTGRWC